MRVLKARQKEVVRSAYYEDIYDIYQLTLDLKSLKVLWLRNHPLDSMFLKYILVCYTVYSSLFYKVSVLVIINI